VIATYFIFARRMKKIIIIAFMDVTSPPVKKKVSQAYFSVSAMQSNKRFKIGGLNMETSSKSLPPAKAPDPPPLQRIKGLNVQVEIKGLEAFKAVFSVIGELVLDTRISGDIRMEYVAKLTAIRDQD